MLIEFYSSERVYNHLTHVTLTVTLGFMAVHVLLSGLKWLRQYYFNQGDNLDTVDKSISRSLAVVATFGTSLTGALYLASALLIAGNSGAFPDDEFLRDNSGKRTMIAFILDHFVPFFAWMPLYACRVEVSCLDSRLRKMAYLSAAPFVAIVYVIVLASLRTSAPAAGIVDIVPSSFAAAAAVVAWAKGRNV